jgi:alanine-synthesizing transaminase
MISYSIQSSNVKYAVRDILIVANQAKNMGLDMKYLNIGDPLKFDHQTPKHMVEAIHQAMIDGQNGYANSSGTEEAIESIKLEAKKKNISNIQDIFVTMGASEAIELVLTALTNPGENILTPYPGYPLYTAIESKLALEENPYYLDEENEWMPDPEDIRKKINKKTRAIVIINPNNPTGSLASKEVLEEIIKIAEEHSLLILADEIYDKIIYDGKTHISIASLNSEQPVITFNGVSKSYLAPGFRIGWGIASGNKVKLGNFLETLNQLLRARLCASTPMMASIKAALTGPQDHLKDLMEKMTIRRDLTFKMLNEIEGITCVKPEGAFYAFPKLNKIEDDDKFVKELILNTGVVVVPGNGFGQKPGSSHFRVVFLPNEKILKEAYSDIAKFARTYK